MYESSASFYLLLHGEGGPIFDKGENWWMRWVQIYTKHLATEKILPLGGRWILRSKRRLRHYYGIYNILLWYTSSVTRFYCLTQFLTLWCVPPSP